MTTDAGDGPEPAATSLPEIPYASALSLGIQKLTSQVLIFLLAYLMLIIGMEFLGGHLATELRALLYVIPILGVLAYVVLARRKMRSMDPTIAVSAGIVSGSTVEGVRGDPSNVSGAVRVRAGLAAGGAIIRGVDTGSDAEKQATADLAYLRVLFLKLDDKKRRILIRAAADLVDGHPGERTFRVWAHRHAR